MEKKEQKYGDALEEEEPSSSTGGCYEFAEYVEEQISSREQKLASDSCTHERGDAD